MSAGGVAVWLCAWIHPAWRSWTCYSPFFLLLASITSVLSDILSVLSANPSYFEAFAKVFIFSIYTKFLFLCQTYKFSISAKLRKFSIYAKLYKFSIYAKLHKFSICRYSHFVKNSFWQNFVFLLNLWKRFLRNEM